MHAAFSVIAFTVLSGAGLGALALVAIADLGATYAGWPALAPRPAMAIHSPTAIDPAPATPA